MKNAPDRKAAESAQEQRESYTAPIKFARARWYDTPLACAYLHSDKILFAGWLAAVLAMGVLA